MIVDCLKCGKEFNKRPAAIKNTKGMNFCSRSCSTTFTNPLKLSRKTIKGNCPNCHNPLYRSSRIYCSAKCANNFKRNELIYKWLHGEISGTTEAGIMRAFVKFYFLEKYNHSCQLCKWKERHPITDNIPLQIHHIDGDWENNNPDNLQLLCPNCHSLTSTYGSLNNGKGRIDRNITARFSLRD